MSAAGFSEIQGPSWWVWLVLLLAGGFPLMFMLQGAAVWPTILPTLLCLLIAVLFMPLRTSLSRGRLRVSYGLASLLTWTFPLDEVQQAESVRYRPLREYLGWGIRRGFDGSRCLTMRGNRGVMLQLANGKRFLVGSQRPEELAASLGK